MKDEIKNKIIKILKDNDKWPLILEGVSCANFPTAVVIPASTPSGELGIISSENGFIYPTWANEIKTLSEKSNKKIIICISGLDELVDKEQNKFYGLVKYKGLNGFKFPESSQIIIPVKNVSNVSKKISSLSLIYKVEK